jgi:hypothetical protein
LVSQIATTPPIIFTQSGQVAGTNYYYVRKAPTSVVGTVNINYIQTSTIGTSTIGATLTTGMWAQTNNGTFTPGLNLSNINFNSNVSCPAFAMIMTPTQSWQINQ